MLLAPGIASNGAAELQAAAKALRGVRVWLFCCCAPYVLLCTYAWLIIIIKCYKQHALILYSKVPTYYERSCFALVSNS